MGAWIGIPYARLRAAGWGANELAGDLMPGASGCGTLGAAHAGTSAGVAAIANAAPSAKVHKNAVDGFMAATLQCTGVNPNRACAVHELLPRGRCYDARLHDYQGHRPRWGLRHTAVPGDAGGIQAAAAALRQAARVLPARHPHDGRDPRHPA